MRNRIALAFILLSGCYSPSAFSAPCKSVVSALAELLSIKSKEVDVREIAKTRQRRWVYGFQKHVHYPNVQKPPFFIPKHGFILELNRTSKIININEVFAYPLSERLRRQAPKIPSTIVRNRHYSAYLLNSIIHLANQDFAEGKKHAGTSAVALSDLIARAKDDIFIESAGIGRGQVRERHDFDLLSLSFDRKHLLVSEVSTTFVVSKYGSRVRSIDIDSLVPELRDDVRWSHEDRENAALYLGRALLEVLGSDHRDALFGGTSVYFARSRPRLITLDVENGVSDLIGNIEIAFTVSRSGRPKVKNVKITTYSSTGGSE